MRLCCHWWSLHFNLDDSPLLREGPDLINWLHDFYDQLSLICQVDLLLTRATLKSIAEFQLLRRPESWLEAQPFRNAVHTLVAEDHCLVSNLQDLLIFLLHVCRDRNLLFIVLLFLHNFFIAFELLRLFWTDTQRFRTILKRYLLLGTFIFHSFGKFFELIWRIARFFCILSRASCGCRILNLTFLSFLSWFSQSVFDFVKTSSSRMSLLSL